MGVSALLYFTIQGVTHRFVEVPQEHLVISQHCQHGTQFRCQAYSALKRAKLTPELEKTLNGRDPGAVVCLEQLKVKVLVGTDPRGNQNSFCKFEDGSLIDTGTIDYYAAMAAKSGQK